jgi:hypothetical protein
MSKLSRALVLTATLAAMNLAAMTTVAHAQANDEPTSNQDARQPPTEGQVGEAWRHPQVAAEQPTVADDTRQPPTEAQVGEAWRHPTSAPVPPAEPSGQPSWLIPSLGVLAATLALAGGPGPVHHRQGRPVWCGQGDPTALCCGHQGVLAASLALSRRLARSRGRPRDASVQL